MKKLVVVRHGHYDDRYQLNDHGRNQIRSLAEQLRPHITDATIKILTSTADRARESGEILSGIFQAEIEQHEVLWSESRHPENLAEALQLVRAKFNEVDVLILTTHYEYVERFPGYFFRKELNMNLRSYLIEKGEAWLIDCEAKTLQHIEPVPVTF